MKRVKMVAFWNCCRTNDDVHRRQSKDLKTASKDTKWPHNIVHHYPRPRSPGNVGG